MSLTDTHVHLYLEEFDADREQVIASAREAGVDRFFLPNIDTSSIDALYDLSDRYAECCFPMMGLHPCSVKKDYKEQLSKVESELGKRRFWAVGEIGIDLHWDKTTLKEQTDAFLAQVRWAFEGGLPVAIHSRDAMDEIIGLLQKNEGNNPAGVFHCFTGTTDQARQVIDLGFFLGVGGVLTFRNAGLDKVLEGVDLSHVVLETDAPYLAPAPHRGKRNEPAYLRLVAQRLSDLKGISLQDVAAITTANATRLFGPNT